MHAIPTTFGIQAAQMAEVYWMALTRDIPFGEFATNSLVRAAAGELRCKGFRKWTHVEVGFSETYADIHVSDGY